LFAAISLSNAHDSGSSAVLSTEALQFEQIPSLQIRLGRAYVATHDYHQAVQFYEDSLRANPYDVDLRLDLAKLLCRLRRFPSAICVLKDCPTDRILDKTKHVQVLIELADVYQQEDPQQVCRSRATLFEYVVTSEFADPRITDRRSNR
jgi:hypothetical protein